MKLFKKNIPAYLITTLMIVMYVPVIVFAQATTVDIVKKTCPLGIAMPPGDRTQCNDGIDNDKDGKVDYYGVDCKTKLYPDGDGNIDIEPDPSCISPTKDQTETADVKTGSEIDIIPCVNKCTISDIFKLVNNLVKFFFSTILLPIMVIMIMYMGWQYLGAESNPGKKADLKSLAFNFIKGILLILCSWLIVITILRTMGYTDSLVFFGS